jgi:hypothetical protein
MARIIFLLIVIIDILAILDVWKSAGSTERKILWIVIILLLPVAGPIAWYLVSRKIINL